MNLYDATEQAYKNGVEAGKPKWIPVTKKLPAAVSKHKRFRTEYTKSNRVLCVCVQKSGKRIVKEGYCEFYEDSHVWRIPGTIDSVTHWMPMPELPGE